MLAQEKGNTITKNCQKIRAVTTHEQTFVSNESIKTRTHLKNI